MMPHDPPVSQHDRTGPLLQDALDRALSTALRAPALPAGFGASLRRAIERETGNEILARRRALEADHAQRVAELHAGYVRMRRNTLATLLAAAFTAGAGIVVVLPRLAGLIGMDIATVAPLLAAMVGLGIGGLVLLERLGMLRFR